MNFKIWMVLAISLLAADLMRASAARADEENEETDAEQGDQEPSKLASNEEFKAMYQKMLKTKRQAHREAVQRMFDLQDSKKQNEMLALVVKKLFEVLDASLTKLNKMQTESDTPDMLRLDQEAMNEISMVIENTAFGADLALHFPDRFHKLYDKSPKYQTLMPAALSLVRQMNLVDLETEKAIHLMSQELNIIEREPGFVNPYRKRNLNVEAMDEHFGGGAGGDKAKTKPKKAKRPRGPGLSGGSRGRGDL